MINQTIVSLGGAYVERVSNPPKEIFTVIRLQGLILQPNLTKYIYPNMIQSLSLHQ